MTELELDQWLDQWNIKQIELDQLKYQEMTTQELELELKKEYLTHPDFIKHNGNKINRDLITQELRHKKLEKLLK